MKQNREKQENQEFEYLAKIPILNTISEMKQPNYDLFEDPKERLNGLLKLLFEDSDAYAITGIVKSFIVATFDIQETGFFGFYKLAQKWLDDVQKENQSSKNEVKDEVKLEDPYELAKQLFMEYVNFRKNATNGAKFKDGCGFDNVPYEANIRDLFTDEDLIELGGNEFIKDCYKQIGIKFNEDIAQEHGIKKKPQIQNINSRTGTILEAQEIAKPHLFKRVDNYLSWKIFKDGKVQDLTEYEKSILGKAMKNEGFWKHLGKTESKILPFTGGAALILGLIAAFAFGATGGALLALILTPIGAGALGIAPIVAPISQRSAIVDKMIDIDNPNKEFNNKLKQGEERYRQYKDKNPDFLKPESEKGKDPVNKEPIIPNINIHPLTMANKVKETANQHQHDGNNKGKNGKKPEEEKT